MVTMPYKMLVLLHLKVMRSWQEKNLSEVTNVIPAKGNMQLSIALAFPPALG